MNVDGTYHDDRVSRDGSVSDTVPGDNHLTGTRTINSNPFGAPQTMVVSWDLTLE